jgi:hypothetical protein
LLCWYVCIGIPLLFGVSMGASPCYAPWIASASFALVAVILPSTMSAKCSPPTIFKNIANTLLIFLCHLEGNLGYYTVPRCLIGLGIFDSLLTFPSGFLRVLPNATAFLLQLQCIAPPTLLFHFNSICLFGVL